MLNTKDISIGSEKHKEFKSFKARLKSSEVKKKNSEKSVDKFSSKSTITTQKTFKNQQNKEQIVYKKEKKISEIMKENKKMIFKPSVLLSPVPAVLVTCRDNQGKDNIITIAWVGTVCSNPPMLSISIRPERYSYHIIDETRQFVVNIPSADQVRWVDYCGVTSGEKVDKFEKTGFTKQEATKINVPIIKECTLNIECTVREKLDLGSHIMFIADVVAIQASQDIMQESGRLAIEKGKLLTYIHGHYYSIGKRLGKFGFSVQKKRTKSTNFSNKKKEQE